MAPQTCEQCGAIVASDEQFCPSCGAYIDPMAHPRHRTRRASSSDKVISVSSDGPSQAPEPEGPYEEFELEEPPPPERPPASPGGGNGGGQEIVCPSCGAVNPAHNRHCQECGARLRQGPLPTAPRPAVQATAGVRAALAISGLLLGVILIALFFNVFSGDNPEAVSSTSSTSTTAAQIEQPGPIDVLDEVCNPEGIGSFVCPNLTSGTPDEYQVSWEENAEDGVTITLTFFEQMAISQIQWSNIENATRFHQNYRAKTLEITAQDSVSGPIPVRLADQQGTQVVDYTSLNTAKLEIKVVEAYDAEVRDNNRFDEIAIDEIVVIGRPVIAPSTDSTTPETGTTSTTVG